MVSRNPIDNIRPRRRKPVAATIWFLAVGAWASTASAQPGDADERGDADEKPVLFREDFESYPNDDALWSRGGPYLDQWRRTVPEHSLIRLLTNQHRHSGKRAVEMNLAGDQESAYGNAILYYRVPLSSVKPHGRLGVSGWISFENLQNARLFFLNELWTGRIDPVQKHYGHTEALLAGGVQYNSRTRTWQWEHGGEGYPYTSFSEVVDYKDGLDEFHFFKLVVDYNTDRYISFQFGKQVWDLSDHKLMVFEPDIAHEPTPAMFELNVRLITYDEYDGPYQCRVIVDDVEITHEGGGSLALEAKKGS